MRQPAHHPVHKNIAREAEVGDPGGQAGDERQRNREARHGAPGQHGIGAALLPRGDEESDCQRQRQVQGQHDPVGRGER